MFKNTIHVPVNKAAEEATDVEIAAARTKLNELLDDSETLSQLRRFFIALGLHGDKTMAGYEMPSSVAEHAQKKFIEKRQEEQDRDGKVKTDDYAFHRHLTLSRYMSIGKMGSL